MKNVFFLVLVFWMTAITTRLESLNSKSASALCLSGRYVKGGNLLTNDCPIYQDKLNYPTLQNAGLFCSVTFTTDKPYPLTKGQKITVKAESRLLNSKEYSIGDTGPAGGLIFYDSGNNSSGWRYLEVSKIDNGANYGMGCYCTEITNTSASIGSGLQNTLNWEKCSGWAQEALKFSSNGYDDWFVPSQDELNEIYKNLQKNGLGNFKNAGYWSSTPGAYGSCGINGGAIVQNFSTGAQYTDYRLGYQGAGYVRWIRKFSGQKDVTYAWSNGEKTQTIEVSPEKTTKYYVTISDGVETCIDSLTIEVNPANDYSIDIFSNKGTSVCTGDTVTLGVKVEATPLSIGSKGPSGGLVFYDKGTNTGGWRYLEAAPQNIGVYPWGCDGQNISAFSSSGLINTMNIVSNCPDSTTAAKKCLDYVYNGYDDWFLPSQFEFSHIYKNLIKNNLGNFDVGAIPARGTLYWTSNQLTTASGSHFCLECDGNFYQYSKIYELYVRPVRRFSQPGFNDTLSYSWSTGQKTATIKVNPTLASVYYVTVTNGRFSVIDSIVITPKECCLPENITKTNLLAAWTFCNNTLDASGNGHHGKIKVGTETYTTDRHGNGNSAFMLDGKSYIEIPHHPAFNGFPFSVSAWVKTESAAHQHVVNKYSAAAWNGWSLWTQSHGSGWYLRSRNDAMISQYDNFPPFNTEGKCDDANWHLITFTVDEKLGYMYYDGILQDTQVWRGTPGKSTSSFPVRIGYYAGDNTYFNGAVDDIAVWDRALSPSEVKNLYDLKNQENKLTLFMDTVISRKGAEVKMPVRANQFKELISAQHSINFDPTTLKFKKVESSILDPDPTNIFGLSQAANGKLLFAWSDENLSPKTLADSTILYWLVFDVIDDKVRETEISITNDPLNIEFMDGNMQVIADYRLVNGLVKLDDAITVTGKIFTPQSKGIPSATIMVSGYSTGQTKTGSNGSFTISLPADKSYVLTPSKSNDSLPANGVTIADVVKIKRHIIQSEMLNSPYKLIAADVNEDKSISLADVNAIISLMKGDIKTFPSGKLWNFVAKGHVFANPSNPYPYPSTKLIDRLTLDENLDFIGIKLGDVDDNYDHTVSRSSRKVQLYFEDQVAIKGSTIRIPVRVRDFEDISGLQLALQWNPAVLSYKKTVQSDGLLLIPGERLQRNGLLQLFWSDIQGNAMTSSNESTLAYIEFDVVGEIGQSTDIRFISTATTPLELVDGNVERLQTLLTPATITVEQRSAVEEGLPLETNVSVFPNPFLSSMQIVVETHEADKLSYTLMDVSGRYIFTHTLQVEKGINRIPVDVDQKSGMYILMVTDSSGRLIKTLRLSKI